jgi:hypothetical protein
MTGEIVIATATGTAIENVEGPDHPITAQEPPDVKNPTLTAQAATIGPENVKTDIQVGTDEKMEVEVESGIETAMRGGESHGEMTKSGRDEEIVTFSRIDHEVVAEEGETVVVTGLVEADETERRVLLLHPRRRSRRQT